MTVCPNCFFFFSSRRRHTRCLSDWSSDVCSSDLLSETTIPPQRRDDYEYEMQQFLATASETTLKKRIETTALHIDGRAFPVEVAVRSEERRVGKECRSRWSPYH